MSRDPIQAAENALSEIVERFPALQVLHQDGAPIEVGLIFPVQDGLKYQVWLGLQNENELHFSVGDFWLEWFPCTQASKARSYVAAVSGFLSGSHRIVEHFYRGRLMKAQLQEPAGQSWKIIGTRGGLLSLLPLPYTLREIRNT